MRCRGSLIALLALGVAVAVASPASTAPPPLPAGRVIYVVQPDPRLCPSPLCGGYWVSRANRPQTRCHDGLYRSRCYVTEAVAWPRGDPIARGIPANGLVRAFLGATDIDGLGRLGVLIVMESWDPATREPATGGYFRIRDTGVRCVRAPCFSLRVWRVNSAYRVTVSELDLGPVGVDPATRRRAEAALTTPAGLLAAGRVSRTRVGGRVFEASQLFLRELSPRA